MAEGLSRIGTVGLRSRRWFCYLLIRGFAGGRFGFSISLGPFGGLVCIMIGTYDAIIV